MKRQLSFFLGFMFAFVSCYSPVTKEKKTTNSLQTDTSVQAPTSKIKKNTPQIKKASSEIKPKAQIIESAHSKLYSLRKHQNVSQFYARIAKKTTEICMEHNVPPAAILAIAGLESGWNEGYVGKITGNILSLGTRKGDYKLPALRLPTLKRSGEILFDSLEIIKYSADELIWKNRPESLKKDYRPLPYAGRKTNLAYFKYHQEKEAQAQIQNITDFVTLFISKDSKIPVYRNTRKLMDEMVAKSGKEILLEKSTANLFINEIGGKAYSFNYRKTWPRKVNRIIKNAGLDELTKKLYKTDSDFEKVW